MKKGIMFTSTRNWDEQRWHDWRMRGIGSSETASVMGADPYKPALRLFLEKTGQWPVERTESFQTYRGKVLEKSILKDYWAFFTTDKESILVNSANPQYVPKKVSKIGGFYQNEKYPHLFSTPDGRSPQGIVKLTDGTINDEQTLIEAKSIASYYAKTFTVGFPQSYLIQTQSQLLVTNLSYVELIILEDGTHPAMYGFDREPILIDAIIAMTQDFWAKVIKARYFIKLKEEALSHGKTDELADLEFELSKLEPGPEDSDSYAEFLTDRYKEKAMEKVLIGSDAQYKMALQLLDIKSQIKPLEANKKMIENTFKAYMGKEDASMINFDDGRGSVSWRKDKNDIFRFNNSVKTP